MGKKRKKRQLPKRAGPKKSSSTLPAFQWMGKDGLHTIQPGLAPSPEQIEAVTKEYQKQIRNSPLWEMMVEQYGEEQAQEMLKEFRYEVRE